MRGKKRKQLRKAVTYALGRPPEGMKVVKRLDDGSYAFIPSEWRRAKQAYKKEQSHGG